MHPKHSKSLQNQHSQAPIDDDFDVEMPDTEESPDGASSAVDPVSMADDSLPEVPSRTRRILPDATTEKLYGSWLALVPTLVPNYLCYLQTSQARIGALPPSQQWACASITCSKKEYSILCLHSHCEMLVCFDLRLLY